MVFITNSAEETEKIGERLCTAFLSAGIKKAFVSMEGEMGVGKTAFTRGFAKPLGIRSVKSPTYTIVNEYRGSVNIYHFDMYRLSSKEEAEELGFNEYFDVDNLDGITLVEWPEQVEGLVRANHFQIKIEKLGEEKRKITLSSVEGDL